MSRYRGPWSCWRSPLSLLPTHCLFARRTALMHLLPGEVLKKKCDFRLINTMMTKDYVLLPQFHKSAKHTSKWNGCFVQVIWTEAIEHMFSLEVAASWTISLLITSDESRPNPLCLQQYWSVINLNLATGQLLSAILLADCFDYV